MNDWTFSVVPGDQQHQQHAAEDRGNGQDDGQRQPEGLEVCGQQQEDHQHGQQQADAKAGDGLLQSRDLAAHSNGDALGRRAGGGQGLVQLLGSLPSVSP